MSLDMVDTDFRGVIEYSLVGIPQSLLRVEARVIDTKDAYMDLEAGSITYGGPQLRS